MFFLTNYGANKYSEVLNPATSENFRKHYLTARHKQNLLKKPTKQSFLIPCCWIFAARGTELNTDLVPQKTHPQKNALPVGLTLMSIFC